MPIIQNKYQKAVIHLNSNSTIVVAGNTSQSNIAIGNENLTGAPITQIWFGSQASGAWILTRGNSSVNTVVAVLDGTGQLKFAESGTSLNIEKDKPINATLIGTSNGFIMIEVNKE